MPPGDAGHQYEQDGPEARAVIHARAPAARVGLARRQQRLHRLPQRVADQPNRLGHNAPPRSQLCQHLQDSPPRTPTLPSEVLRRLLRPERPPADNGRGMSQISPPIRILLVCAVAFMAAWMLFLRPKDDAGTPAAATPTAPSSRPVDAAGAKADSLAGKAVEKANEATAAQDARAEELAGGTGETAATPSATAAAPAATTATGAPTRVTMPSKEELASVPAPVRRAIVGRKIIVLGVLSKGGIDDRSVRKRLKLVDKLHGRVFVKALPVERISRYEAITRGADVSQTPSVVIVDF